MEKTKILKKVQSIVANYSSLNESQVTLESDISKDLGLDSYDIISIQFDTEKEFNISLYDDELFDVDTINDLVNLIEKKTQSLK